MSGENSSIRGDALNWLARYVTFRNVGQYLGAHAMTALVEARWAREQRAGDLLAILPDHFVRPGATVVDVGASYGLFTYHLARRIGAPGMLYAFEPHPINTVVLQKLAKAQPQVVFRQTALSDAAGNAELVVPKRHGRLVTAQSSIAHSFDDVDGVSVERLQVPTARLDDEIGEAEVDFVKIDVEGHEIAVLRGGAAVFKRWQPPLLIEIEQRHLTIPIESVFDVIREFGYELYCVDGTVLRPIADFDLERDQLSKVVEGKFSPFSMPPGYVNNFCAVKSPDILDGLPLAHR